jgi:hypothetical protein
MHWLMMPHTSIYVTQKRVSTRTITSGSALPYRHLHGSPQRTLPLDCTGITINDPTYCSHHESLFRACASDSIRFIRADKMIEKTFNEKKLDATKKDITNMPFKVIMMTALPVSPCCFQSICIVSH